MDEALKTPRVSAAIDANSLDRDVTDFEIEAQHMLERMDCMLMVTRNIKDQPDPTRRVEVCLKKMEVLLMSIVDIYLSYCVSLIFI